MGSPTAVSTKEAPQAIGPYSQAIKSPPFVFVSGQIPLTPQGQPVQGGFGAQVHQVLKNLEAILTASGTSLKHVVKVTVYLKDMENFQEMNEIYGTYFKAPFPSRAAVEVSRLPKGVSVEMDCIATLPTPP